MSRLRQILSARRLATSACRGTASTCPSARCTRVSAPAPPASGNSRVAAGTEPEGSASLHRHGLAQGVRRDSPECVLAAVVENQLDRLYQALPSLFLRSALAVRTWNFGAVGDEPLPVALDDRPSLSNKAFDPTGATEVARCAASRRRGSRGAGASTPGR
jgi:hypothetical protein